MKIPNLSKTLVERYTKQADECLNKITVRSSEDIKATNVCLKQLLATGEVKTGSEACRYPQVLSDFFSRVVYSMRSQMIVQKTSCSS